MVYVRNIPELYTEALVKIAFENEEDTRNGKVLSCKEPTLFTVQFPMERVLFDPYRKANPYFHVMETVWMLAGQNKVDFLLPFNSRMDEYADSGYINGAYGHRWRHGWAHDQIYDTIALLVKDPNTRQAVIAMWNPDLDGPHRTTKDRPCNTHLYFRIVGEELEMTVCNRSNDLVWGMAGANAVHMTYLHELIARATGYRVGRYHIMTNNLHIYEHHWPLIDRRYETHDYYRQRDYEPVPILSTGESVTDLLAECKRFCMEPGFVPRNYWLLNVALPMREIYLERKGLPSLVGYYLEDIGAADWREACRLWGTWHD